MAYKGGELAPWFSRDSTDRAIRNMVRLGVNAAREVTETNTPIETGDLRSSWEVGLVVPMMSSEGPAKGARWYTEIDYAPFVEHGTGLYGPEHRYYLIQPKTPGGTLHWVGAGGVDVYAKKVMHPGSPGNHMVAIAASFVDHNIYSIVRPALRRWALETLRQGDGIS